MITTATSSCSHSSSHGPEKPATVTNTIEPTQVDTYTRPKRNCTVIVESEGKQNEPIDKENKNKKQKKK
jgi:hypothetical protein